MNPIQEALIALDEQVVPQINLARTELAGDDYDELARAAEHLGAVLESIELEQAMDRLTGQV